MYVIVINALKVKFLDAIFVKCNISMPFLW